MKPVSLLVLAGCLLLLDAACSAVGGAPGGGRRGAGHYVSERSSRRERELRPDGTFRSREGGETIYGLYFSVGDTVYFVPALGSARLAGDTIVDADGEEWVRQGLGARADRAQRGGDAEAYTAAMKSDLRNLVTAQESYFADQVTYTSDLISLNFTASSGVTVRIGTASGTGWNATASHSGTSATCGIFVGSARSPITGANEGEPRCR